MLRYRRTKLGISQARLGELVGRSAATIRSWEADKSLPTDASIIPVLSAVIGVDERTLYDKTGIEPPVVEETSPTIEEALASLAPPTKGRTPEVEDVEVEVIQPEPSPADDDEEPVMEPVPTLFETIDEEEELELAQLLPDEDEPTQVPVVTRLTTTLGRRDGRPIQPKPEPVRAPVAVMVSPEKSYIEDPVQRQFYQFRTLATVVGLVALAIAFFWGLTQGLSAFAQWWSEFFGNLRL